MNKMMFIYLTLTLMLVGCDYDPKMPYVKTDNMLYHNYGEGTHYCDLGMLQDTSGRTIMDNKGKPISCTIVHLTTEQLINY